MRDGEQRISPVQNLVVARYQNGEMVKGITHDFGPQKRSFHVVSLGEDGGEGRGKVSEVFFSDLKAVFFVRSLRGNPDRPSSPEASGERPSSIGLINLKVTFLDGETIIGSAQGFDPSRKGFFIVPLEGGSNNLRIFIISSAVKKMETWK